MIEWDDFYLDIVFQVPGFNSCFVHILFGEKSWDPEVYWRRFTPAASLLFRVKRNLKCRVEKGNLPAFPYIEADVTSNEYFIWPAAISNGTQYHNIRSAMNNTDSAFYHVSSLLLHHVFRNQIWTRLSFTTYSIQVFPIPY